MITEAYNKRCTSENSFYSYFDDRYIGLSDDVRAAVSDLVTAAYNQFPNKDVFIFSDSSSVKIIKILRACERWVCDYVKDRTYGNLYWVVDRRSRTHIHLMRGRRRMMTFRIGDGSDSISTEQQESMTVKLINQYIEDREELTSDDIALVSTEPFDDESWIISWTEQYRVIREYLISQGWKLRGLRAVRYGDSSNPLSVYIRDLYLKRLTKLVSTKQKDNIDPSDIFIYRLGHEQEIISRLHAQASKDDDEAFQGVKSEYYDLLREKLMIGVSLKKVTSSSVVLHNGESGDDSFRGAQFGKITYDPLSMMIDKSKIAEFRRISDINQLRKLYKPNGPRSCNISISYDGHTATLIFKRSTGDHRGSMSLEPISSRSSRMGKVEVKHWRDLIISKAGSYKKVADIMSDRSRSNYSIRYSDYIQDLSEMWEVIRSRIGSDVLSSDIVKLFKVFSDVEDQIKDELWLIFHHIFFLYAILSSGNDTRLPERLLRWSVKIGDTCLPYLFLESEMTLQQYLITEVKKGV